MLGFRVLSKGWRLRDGAVGWQALQSVADLEVLAKACHERFGGGGLGLTAADDAEWAEPDHVLVTPQYALPNCNWGSLSLSFHVHHIKPCSNLNLKNQTSRPIP